MTDQKTEPAEVKTLKEQLKQQFNPSAMKYDTSIGVQKFFFPANGISSAWLFVLTMEPIILSIGLLLQAGMGYVNLDDDRRRNTEETTWTAASGQTLKGNALQRAQHTALQEDLIRLHALRPTLKDDKDIKKLDKILAKYDTYKTELFQGVTVLKAGYYGASETEITFLTEKLGSKGHLTSAAPVSKSKSKSKSKPKLKSKP